MEKEGEGRGEEEALDNWMSEMLEGTLVERSLRLPRNKPRSFLFFKSTLLLTGKLLDLTVGYTQNRGLPLHSI